MNSQHVVTALLIAIGATVSACGGSRQLRLTSSSDIPAATSTVKVATSSNGNTTIDLVVEHLAIPARVQAGATAYVVWVRGLAPGSYAQSLGALKVNDDLNGSLKAVTPLRSFELFITAEPTQGSPTPSGKALLYTTVTMK